jgi:hypothetical protein
MKPRTLGRFVAEFLEGLAGGRDAVEADLAAPLPPVVPLEAVREAVRAEVASILRPIIEGMAAEGVVPPPQPGLFDEAMPPDPYAEAIRRRVAQTNAETAAREREAAGGGTVPPFYDPNAPDNGAPWMAPVAER